MESVIIRPDIQLSKIMTFLDWIIFGLAIGITLLTVLYGEIRKRASVNKLSKDAQFLDFLLMGRQLTLPMFVATLVATWYGGIFGVTKIAFEQGIYNFITQGFFWYLTYIIFAFFIVEKIAPYNAVTLPHLIGKMFGPKSAYLSGIFNFFNVLPITYTVSLGLLIQYLFNTPFITSMVIGVSFVIFYSMWGGLRSVIYSDLIQFFIMCIGVSLIIIFSIQDFGGLSFLVEKLPKSYWSPTGTVGIGTTILWGFIALSTLVDPNFYQRCFSAKSPAIAKRGILISTFIWLCFDLCTTFGAMYARAVIPNANSEGAYLIYAVQLLPSGLRGLFLSGILATILSTLDSYLFLASATIHYDLAPSRWKNNIFLRNLGSIVIGILSIVMAIHFEGNIKNIWKTLGSYSSACLFLPVLYGYIFPNRIKDNQFVFSCLLGVLGITFWRNTSIPFFGKMIDEFYMGILFTTLGLVTYPFILNFKNKR